MPDGSEATTLRVLGAIAEVPAEQWDACAGADDPFACHAFLSALVDGESVTA